jgi:hypothetical protein
MRVSRRIWLRGVATVVCATLVLGLWAFWLEPASLGVSKEQVHLEWPPRSLRIAILTDLHVGSPFNGIAKLRRVVDLTNAHVPT